MTPIFYFTLAISIAIFIFIYLIIKMEYNKVQKEKERQKALQQYEIVKNIVELIHDGVTSYIQYKANGKN